MNKNELRYLGIKEELGSRVSELTDRVVELRVEITELTQENERLKARLAEYDKDVDVQEDQG